MEERKQKLPNWLEDMLGVIALGGMGILFITILQLSEETICLNFGYILLSGILLISFGYLFGRRFERKRLKFAKGVESE